VFVDEDADAKTQRTNAGISAVAAAAAQEAAETAASGAAASAATATSKATIATNQATAASTSAGNAATSETNAAASAATATTKAGQVATAKTAVDAAKADLDARFYPPSATDPTGAVDGGTATPIQEGARYPNTVINRDKLFVSGAWRDPVGDAVTAATTAAGYLASTSSLALQAAASASAALASSQTVQTITGLSNLSAAARTAMFASNVTGLAAISTAEDRGGEGDWTVKCAGASWQSFGAFPRLGVATLCTSTNAVSILSRSDPSLPVWWSWTSSSLNTGAVEYFNGALRYGSGVVLYTIDFVRDRVLRRNNSGLWIADQNVAAFNQLSASWTQIDSNAIANSLINGIAATALPHAPLDPLRANLAHATTAVASNAGVRVIRSDGVVVNSNSSTATLACCWTRAAPDAAPLLWTLTASGLSVAGQYLAASWDVAGLATFTAAQLGVGAPAKLRAIGPHMVAIVGSTGVARIRLDAANPANSLISVKTPSVETGWMVGAQGAAKLALAESSADVTSKTAGATFSDRSTATNNATVVGTIARAVVAAGADLAGYTGWGSANYLSSPPYAFGSTDFEIDMSIVGAAASGTQIYWMHGYYTGGAYSGAYAKLQSVGSTLSFALSDGTNTSTVTWAGSIAAGATYHVRCVRRAATGQFEMWLNGVRVATAAVGSVGSLTNASGKFYIGCDAAGYSVNSATVLTLVKVALTAATPDQIAAMHAAETPLFQAGGKCLLSAAPQAIAYDPSTDLLALGSATAGADVFRRMIRVGRQASTAAANRLRDPNALTAALGALGSLGALPTGMYLSGVPAAVTVSIVAHFRRRRAGPSRRITATYS